jgi:hypothetical protein
MIICTVKNALKDEKGFCADGWTRDRMEDKT